MAALFLLPLSPNAPARIPTCSALCLPSSSLRLPSYYYYYCSRNNLFLIVSFRPPNPGISQTAGGNSTASPSPSLFLNNSPNPHYELREKADWLRWGGWDFRREERQVAAMESSSSPSCSRSPLLRLWSDFGSTRKHESRWQFRHRSSYCIELNT